MQRKVWLGGSIGALVILIFSLGLLLLFNNFSLDFNFADNNLLFSIMTIFLAPVAGGFVAGLISRPQYQMAGLLAGAGAGVLLLTAWMGISGFSLRAGLSGGVIAFIWIVFARMASGFAKHD